MAELADALDSGSNGRKFVQVQVLLSAPKEKNGFDTKSFFFLLEIVDSQYFFHSCLIFCSVVKILFFQRKKNCNYCGLFFVCFLVALFSLLHLLFILQTYHCRNRFLSSVRTTQNVISIEEFIDKFYIK